MFLNNNAFLFSMFMLSSRGISTDAPVAITEQGTIQGTHVNEAVSAFLGVPYAQPPTGNLRWRPPQSWPQGHVHRGDMLNRTQFGHVCYQFHYRSVFLDNALPSTPESEDCLNLNVFVPRGYNPSELLPTFVWQYGGGFSEGGGSVPMFNPTAFVASQTNMIVVTINYRLNIFGYPNAPAIPINEQNMGLRDQRAALEWLRDNLVAFGGDPDKITLGGESAGADSAAAQMFAYPNDPIARGLILESGQPLAIGESDATGYYTAAKVVGCRDPSNGKIELECMKKVPAEKLKHAFSNSTFHPFGALSGGMPMVDNLTHFSVAGYSKRGNQGKFARIPVLLGINNREGDGVVNWSPKCGVNKTASNIYTKSFFNCPVALETSYRTKFSVPIWRYRYMGVFPSVTFYPWLGTYHEAEVPMLMGTYENLKPHKPAPKYEHAASKFLQDIFGTFIRHPHHGLKEHMGFPIFNPNRTTLIEISRNNSATAKLQDPQKYDAICADPPPLPPFSAIKPPHCRSIM